MDIAKQQKPSKKVRYNQTKERGTYSLTAYSLLIFWLLKERQLCSSISHMFEEFARGHISLDVLQEPITPEEIQSYSELKEISTDEVIELYNSRGVSSDLLHRV